MKESISHFEKFNYDNTNYVIFAELFQIVKIVENVPYWSLFESIQFRTNIETNESETVDFSILNLIENANWKKYINPSDEMIENINLAFQSEYTKEDFLN